MHAWKSFAELQLAGGGRCLELRLLLCYNILKALSFKCMKYFAYFLFFLLFCTLHIFFFSFCFVVSVAFLPLLTDLGV